MSYDSYDVSQPRLFALSESRHLAAEVSQESELAHAPLEERRFEGGEFKLRPLESVRDRSVIVLQCLAGTDDCPVAERLLRLLFLVQGLRDAGASRITAVLPYLPFARKDRRTQPRDPVTSRYVAELLEASGLARVVTLDVHNPAALDNAFRIPVDHLSAHPLMIAHFADRLGAAALTVGSPDVGGIKRAQLMRELMQARLGREVGLVFVEKRRALGVVSGGMVTGEVAGTEVVLIDDLSATGHTLARAARACLDAGARRVHVAFTHAPLPEAIAMLVQDAAIASITVTNSAATTPSLIQAAGGNEKLTVLSVGALLGQALHRICSGSPLLPLLTRWPVGADERA